MNEPFSKMNEKYLNIISILKDNEEKRINYISFHLEKYITLIEEERNSFDSCLISIRRSEDRESNKLISFKVKLDENMKMYQDKFNFMYKSYKRFMNEDFISYDIYRRKIESIINSTKNLIQKGNDIDLFDTTISNTIIQTSPNDYNQSIFNNENENIVMENDDSIICNNLFKENTVNINKKLSTEFLKKLKSNVSFCHNDILKNED